jgi:hypothetical protein
MTKNNTPEAMQHFLHGQLEAWNSGDKKAFFDIYREASPGGLEIDYVGRPRRDAWEILETMWKDHNATLKVEVERMIINGTEAACHHINRVTATGFGIHTIELYAFDGEKLNIRYFIAS